MRERTGLVLGSSSRNTVTKKINLSIHKERRTIAKNIQFVYNLFINQLLSIGDMAKEITDAEFEAEVLKSDVPVMVDFWAPWCGPCKQLGPIVEELAGEIEGKPYKIVKMNIDENNETPSKYGVMSIPTLMFFKGGSPADQMVGVQPKETMQSKLEELAG